MNYFVQIIMNFIKYGLDMFFFSNVPLWNTMLI